MKKIFFSISIILYSISHAQITNPAPYCGSSFQNNYNMVQNVSINGTSFSIGTVGSWSSTNTYKYYNNAVFPSLTAGNTATFSIGFYSVQDAEPRYFSMWIDYNNNNTFDANELVMSNATTTNTDLPTFNQPNVTVNKTIAIPVSVTAGSKRIRLVRSQDPANPFAPYSSAVTLQPCNTTSTFAYGCTYDFSVNITAGGGATAPVANFSFPSTICTGKTYTLTDNSTNTPTTWSWTAVGATNPPAAIQNPVISFNSAGVYTVTLVAGNAGGSSAPVSKTLTVNASPTINILPNNTTICQGNSVTMTVSGAATYSWSNGSTSTSVNVTPSVTTNYSVTGTSQAGCSVLASKTVSVVICTGVESFLLNENNIRIYPNPASDVLQVSIPSGTFQDYALELYNTLGQMVAYKKTSGNLSQITIEHLESGYYHLVIKSGDQVLKSSAIYINNNLNK
ncbi:MAG: T9SS type A sorting domain-containing protein [Sediminibacterium sp.]|nr:T9SS type A sorting domain-containing protein [Sediminibacterium sp.]